MERTTWVTSYDPASGTERIIIRSLPHLGSSQEDLVEAVRRGDPIEVCLDADTVNDILFGRVSPEPYPAPSALAPE